MKSALYLRRKLMRIGLAASGCAKSNSYQCVRTYVIQCRVNCKTEYTSTFFIMVWVIVHGEPVPQSPRELILEQKLELGLIDQPLTPIAI